MGLALRSRWVPVLPPIGPPAPVYSLPPMMISPCLVVSRFYDVVAALSSIWPLKTTERMVRQTCTQIIKSTQRTNECRDYTEECVECAGSNHIENCKAVDRPRRWSSSWTVLSQGPSRWGQEIEDALAREGLVGRSKSLPLQSTLEQKRDVRGCREQNVLYH